MRGLVVCAIFGCTLVSPLSFAQRGGFAGRGGSGGGHGRSSLSHSPSHPGVWPSQTFSNWKTGLPPAARFMWGAAEHGRPAHYPWGGYAPYFPGFAYGAACNDDCQAAPPGIIVASQPAPPPAPAPPPPEPAKPVMREYQWPEVAHHGDDATLFSLVANDGSVKFARAVWVQDGALHYSAADQTPAVIPLASLDRAATRRLNAETGVQPFPFLIN